jgi:hypothetical protein
MHEMMNRGIAEITEQESRAEAASNAGSPIHHNGDINRTRYAGTLTNVADIVTTGARAACRTRRTVGHGRQWFHAFLTTNCENAAHPVGMMPTVRLG